MKFSAAVSSVFMAGSALAAPATTPVTAFDVMSLRSASPIHFGALSASQKGFFLNLPNQGATCKGDNNRATLYLDGSKLFLYSDEGKPQQVFVDRSGMGQGIIGYVDAGSGFPRNSELEGWSINKDDSLVFDGQILQACPNSIDGAWRVWTTTVQEPAGSKGCLGFTPRVLYNDKPVSCQYS